MTRCRRSGRRPLPCPPRRLTAAVLALALAALPALQAAPALAAAASVHKRAPRAHASVASRMVAIARHELARGVHEIPDGSNRAPAIRRYETATRGAMYGAPWCAYFASWVARQAGVPIGAGGSGIGYVPYIRAWARATHRYTHTPRAGELITFPEHVGIVETVYSNGSMTTIEGNAGNAVRREWRSKREAVGFVRLDRGPAPAPVRLPAPARRPARGAPVSQRLIARIHAYPGTAIAAGQRVDFTSEDSSGNVVRSEWDLDGNGRYETTGDSVSHTFTRAGTVIVRLRVRDSGGHTSTATARILVRANRPPVARAALSAPEVTVGTTVSVDASGSTDPDGRIVRYEWDLDGDGTFTPGSSHASTRFDVPGDHLIGLRVTDDAGNQATTTVAVRVDDLPLPVAAPQCDAATVAAGTRLHCSSDDSGSAVRIARHDWDMNGDGTTDATGRDVRYAWQTPGTYTVTLRVTDARGRQATAATTVVVTDQAPVARVSAPATAGLDQAVTLDASGSYDPDGRISKTEWDLDGDGTYDATGSRTTARFSTTGPHTVTVRVTDDHGVQSTATATVLVVDAPPTARIVAPYRPVAGADVTLDGTRSTDPDDGIVTWEWDLDGDGTYETSGSRITTRFATAGTYTVTLRVTDAHGATAVTRATVTVRSS